MLLEHFSVFFSLFLPQIEKILKLYIISIALAQEDLNQGNITKTITS